MQEFEVNPFHDSGTYSCWQCVKRDVKHPGDVCGRCDQKIRDHLRFAGRRTTVTHESTHRKYRACLEEADRVKTGEKPKYQPGFQDEHASHGRESWDQYMQTPTGSSNEVTSDGVVIKNGADVVLESMADRWLRDSKAEAKRLAAEKRKQQ